jgi:hypothetical protein
MTTILRLERKITLPEMRQPTGKPFNPEEFFETGEGLFVEGGFEILILEDARPITTVPPLEVSIFTLTRRTTDEKIQRILPARFAFQHLSGLCYRLARMLQYQAGGESGLLLNNGGVSVFYVYSPPASELFAVRTNLYRHSNEWNLSARPLDSSNWKIGSRFFSVVAA